MDHSIEAKMLAALELFHYESRFREKLFVIALEARASLTSILVDLRILQASDIQVLIFCRETPALLHELKNLRQRGEHFVAFTQQVGESLSPKMCTAIRRALSRHETPVIGLDRDSGGEEPTKLPTVRAEIARAFALQALDAAEMFDAVKVFFLSSYTGLEVAGKLKSHPTAQEIEGFLASDAEINIGKDMLRFISDENSKRGIEIILLEATPGALFEEIFTHRGKGTLFTTEYPNVVRRGELSDITDLLILMKPSIASGAILPVTEEEIAAHVQDYFIYTVNGAMVASALLKDFGTSAELAKFATLPRFQGRGRARHLARKMIETARTSGKEYVFALSVEPMMWEFFQALGFHEVPRESLPEVWKTQYDFSRPSKAFRLELTAAG